MNAGLERERLKMKTRRPFGECYPSLMDADEKKAEAKADAAIKEIRQFICARVPVIACSTSAWVRASAMLSQMSDAIMRFESPVERERHCLTESH